MGAVQAEVVWGHHARVLSSGHAGLWVVGLRWPPAVLLAAAFTALVPARLHTAAGVASYCCIQPVRVVLMGLLLRVVFAVLGLWPAPQCAAGPHHLTAWGPGRVPARSTAVWTGRVCCCPQLL